MTRLSRRKFLSSSLLGMTALALPDWVLNHKTPPGVDPLLASPGDFSPFFPGSDAGSTGEMVRVATTTVSVYSQPSDKSTILYQRKRDDLVNVYYEVISPDGPGFNPLWYRVWRGYIHSANLQKVSIRFNPVPETFPEKTNQLAEVTVPFAPTMRYLTYNKTWQPIYRLYQGSLQWITGLETGPDGSPWYRVQDELTEVEYLSPASHFRLVDPSEYAPLPSKVDPWKKWIEVSLKRQVLTAYEDREVVFETKISSGLSDYRNIPGLVPTNTPTGEFNIYSKMPSKHMGDGQLTSDPEAYELPGVAWTTFFAPHGVAFHGTYWHQNFGVPMSHGCVNMKTDEALWIYRWTTPVAPENTVETIGYGTQVIVKS